jgi:hypothetical protein
VLVILCVEGRPTAKRKWSSNEPEVDNGKMNVYKATMMYYNGENLREKFALKETLKSIIEMDWDDFMHSKMFNDYSSSS